MNGKKLSFQLLVFNTNNTWSYFFTFSGQNPWLGVSNSVIV